MVQFLEETFIKSGRGKKCLMEHLIWIYGLARRRERARAKPRRGRKREERKWTGKVAIVLMAKLGCHVVFMARLLLPSRCAALCTSTVTSTNAGPSRSKLNIFKF